MNQPKIQRLFEPSQTSYYVITSNSDANDNFAITNGISSGNQRVELFVSHTGQKLQSTILNTAVTYLKSVDWTAPLDKYIDLPNEMYEIIFVEFEGNYIPSNIHDRYINLTGKKLDKAIWVIYRMKQYTDKATQNINQCRVNVLSNVTSNSPVTASFDVKDTTNITKYLHGHLGIPSNHVALLITTIVGYYNMLIAKVKVTPVIHLNDIKITISQ